MFIEGVTIYGIRDTFELNRHTTRIKIRGSVVSLSFIFPHPPEDEKKKNYYRMYWIQCTVEDPQYGDGVPERHDRLTPLELPSPSLY